MELLNRKNGKAGNCACCGRPMLKGQAEAVKFDGNTIGMICDFCFDGDLPVNKVAFKAPIISDKQLTNAVTTRNHDLQIVCDNPFTAIECFVQFGGKITDVKADEITVEVKNQKACYKLGHLFSKETNRMLDGYKTITVNNEVVNTLDEYHRVVKVWG